MAYPADVNITFKFDLPLTPEPRSDNAFKWNQDMTQNNPKLTFDPINGIEGLKLMHMYKLHGYTNI